MHALEAHAAPTDSVPSRTEIEPSTRPCSCAAPSRANAPEKANAGSPRTISDGRTSRATSWSRARRVRRSTRPASATRARTQLPVDAHVERARRAVQRHAQPDGRHGVDSEHDRFGRAPPAQRAWRRCGRRRRAPCRRAASRRGAPRAAAARARLRAAPREPTARRCASARRQRWSDAPSGAERRRARRARARDCRCAPAASDSSASSGPTSVPLRVQRAAAGPQRRGRGQLRGHLEPRRGWRSIPRSAQTPRPRAAKSRPRSCAATSVRAPVELGRGVNEQRLLVEDQARVGRRRRVRARTLAGRPRSPTAGARCGPASGRIRR